MDNQNLMRPAGVHPRALPPDFNGWDAEAPTPSHALGAVTAIDHDTGLPIVKRLIPAQQQGMVRHVEPIDTSAKPVEKPAENRQIAEKPKTLQPATGSKPHAKGTPVQMADGSRGTVAFSDDKVARVRTEDGRNVTAKHRDLVPLQKVQVKAHTRLVPGGDK